ncbi:MAG: DUF5666 domain-containing protein [Acidobacteriaceae bacterium]
MADNQSQNNPNPPSTPRGVGEKEYHYFHHRRTGLRIILAVLIGFLILFVGMAIGGKFGRYNRGGYSVGYGPGMMGRHFDNGGFGGYGGMGKRLGMNNGIFGTISNIQGNKITITNNSGQQQDVITQSTTLIIENGSQIGLNGLKSGQNIIVSGTTDSNNQITARIIQVQ